MTTQSSDESVAVMPTTEVSSSSSTPTQIPSTTTSNVFGTITKTIGTGDNAKNSIVWMTITWSFSIASTISVLLFISLWVAYYKENNTEVLELKKHMISVWSVFTPIITLALGYAFGRNETK